ncbi:N-acetylmuramoyl-L-alanine amidase [Desertibaculum subflavum]|uniref:N-acetylmuramoyl-L-alanine amidase n=1 Tax=Desertibaculum subflavum TaxID=2268458 RepID=UPI000E6677ED
MIPVRESPSPNCDARLPGVPIDILLLHYTGMQSAAAALARLCDPAAEVSAHYLIDEDGTIHRLVPEDRRAWHAGKARWQGAEDINARSIGIELVNPGHEWGYRPFPEAQMAALEALALDIVSRQAIPPRRVLGHSDVAPTRKQDPGELFDWARLARAGLGLWPRPDFVPPSDVPAVMAGQRGPAVLDLQIALDTVGYWVEGTGLFDPLTEAAVTALQRHFRPRRVDGIADAETQGLAFHLAEIAAA